MAGLLVHDPYARSGYFHAWYNYRVTGTLPEGENEWVFLQMETGKNPQGDRNCLNLDTEGDDMIFIDGTEMPTLHGTGTEAYFNSSWCPGEQMEGNRIERQRASRHIIPHKLWN